MSEKPSDPALPADHPMIRAGFIHEATVMQTFGLTWSTWRRNYRYKIPGKTLPSGRWFHQDQLRQWWGTVVE